MHLTRVLKEQIIQHIIPWKVLVLYGPRQIGKTTLVKEILKEHFGNEKVLSVSGDFAETKNIFSSQSLVVLENAVKGYDLLFIDEAQKIDQIGINLKILVDHFPNLKIIATGSSSFHLKEAFWEPLVWRKFTYRLYPIAFMELSKTFNPIEISGMLSQRLIYWGYPEIFQEHMNANEKQRYLMEIVENYLYKDLLELDEIRHRKKIIDLLWLLAFQIGHEVSLNELARSLEISGQTVDKYLYYLEESFVIYRLRGFSRNLRNEITKTCRYYYYDNWIRNAIIQNFNDLSRRNDIGMLWENFLVMERLKKQEYQSLYTNNYFWRTHTQKEIDWIEEYDGILHWYEFKYWDKHPKVPKTFIEAYPESTYEVINKENYILFVT